MLSFIFRDIPDAGYTICHVVKRNLNRPAAVSSSINASYPFLSLLLVFRKSVKAESLVLDAVLKTTRNTARKAGHIS